MSESTHGAPFVCLSYRPELSQTISSNNLRTGPQQQKRQQFLPAGGVYNKTPITLMANRTCSWVSQRL